jgi:hypothetical protein
MSTLTTKTNARRELAHARKIFQASALALKRLARDPRHRNAFVFVVASAFVEYLSKLAYDGGGAQAYKRFIREYLASINPKYCDFEYRLKDGTVERDLPEQMYHVLRCGAIHSYSLVPDKQAVSSGGRDRSIMLSHRISKNTHLALRYHDGQPTCTFVAESFAADIGALVATIFKLAAKDKGLASRIRSWMKKHPPIQGGFAITAQP